MQVFKGNMRKNTSKTKKRLIRSRKNPKESEKSYRLIYKNEDYTERAKPYLERDDRILEDYIKKLRKNPNKIVKKNPEHHSRDLYYTDLITFINENDNIRKMMKDRYGPFMMGVIDTMDATYSYKLKKEPNLTPQRFFYWYILTGQDLKDTEDFYNLTTDPRMKKELKELIDLLKKKKLRKNPD